MDIMIKTERLKLRRFTRADSQDLRDFLAHPSVARATPEIKPTVAGVQKYIDTQNGYQLFEQDRCFDLAIEHRQDQKVIGLLTLVTRAHQMGEIGWALNFDYRGRGFATEAAAALINHAFSELSLHRIQATTSSANPDSISVMERLGMQREAVLREAELREGQWVDSLIYGLLANN